MVIELGLAYMTNKITKYLFSEMRKAVGERVEKNFMPDDLKVGDEFTFVSQKWEYKLICLSINDTQIKALSHEAYVNGQVVKLKNLMYFTLNIIVEA